MASYAPSSPAVDNPATVSARRDPDCAGAGDDQHLTPARTLPSQWYRDERIYQLERRAIFSKKWILATHTSRFSKEGDYVLLEIGNNPYFVIQTKEGEFNAYHNVCRHRGYPLVSKLSGCAPTISCQYHGWCYSPSDGALVRSTHGSFPSFNAAEYSLFKIHTHVLPSGFIFINMGVEDPAPFSDWFGDLEKEWQGFRPDDYEYAYSWCMTGLYNWKTFMDGYQECVHCHLAHPGLAGSLDFSTYAVEPKQNYACHITSLKVDAEKPSGAGDHDAAPSFTYIFPSNGVTVTDIMWYMMRVPISATQTRMEYDVFKHKSVSLERLREYMRFYEKVEEEDFALVSATQKSLNNGIYRDGSLHPTKENGVIYYQDRVRHTVEEHLEIEKAIAHEWNPALPLTQGGGRGPNRFQEIDHVCRSLGPELQW